MLITDTQDKPNKIDINAVLLEFIKNRETDTEITEETAKVDSSLKKGPSKQKSVVIQESITEGEGSRPRKAEKSTAAKPSNQKVTSEEGDKRESPKPSGKKKGKVKKISYRLIQSHLKETKTLKQKNNKPKNISEDESVEEEVEEDLEESTSDWERSTRASNAARSKTKTKKRKSQDEESKAQVPVSSPRASKGPPKKKKTNPPARQKVRSQTAPPSAISGFSFENTGGGNMTNDNVGNVYNSVITGVGNDYSVNHFHSRRERVYA